MKNNKELIDSLSPLERKVIPYLNLSFKEIKNKSGLDKVSVLRALSFLEKKGVLSLIIEDKRIIDLGTNGIYYKKNHLPERRLIIFLEKNNHSTLEEAEKKAGLSENEFRAALGALKSKALIDLKNGKISLKAGKIELAKKFLEERILDLLPYEEHKLSPEMKHALNLLSKRKDIIENRIEQEIKIVLNEIGKGLAGKEIESDLIEEVNSEIIKNWTKDNKFRKYDINSKAPEIYGGKKHFVNQAVDYAKRIWLDMGFKEMGGEKVVSSFWNFDCLYTPQDHPVREMQDTFFIKDVKAKIKEASIMDRVKKAHENGVGNSLGWRYIWQEKEAEKVILRTHTTAISAKTLSGLKKDNLPVKYFAVGKCFRNETVDWSHGFEFNQTEGIVVDRNANFRHLLGYLKEFFRKMGFENIRFTPSYFPYTEPSVEIHVYHEGKKIWLELGGAGIFRPEVVIPLLGEYIPVLAWGPGFDRMLMDYYKIQDLREMYGNDLKNLREKKAWIK